MQALQINSMISLGLPPFIIGPAVGYIHRAELAVCARQEIFVPCSANFYGEGSADWTDELVAEGMPWHPDEKKILDHLISLLPQIAADGANDVVYQAICSGKLTVCPFAYPIVFQTPDGHRYPGGGLMHPDGKRLLLQRHRLVNAPLALLGVMYHEGLHGAIQADEKVAHTGQLEFMRLVLAWLGTRPNSAALPTHVEMVQREIATLQLAVSKL